MPSAPRHVLSGVRVLDFTQFIAGPIVTRLMAEMGAEVIKIELAPDGDLARAMPTMRDGRSAYYAQHNTGKKSVCVDLRRPEGLEVVKALVAKVDVLVENFSPGVIGRLGLGWDVVRAINPDLVMCAISAFGQDGPLAPLRGFDFIAQAYSGVTSMIGDPDGRPALTGMAVGDVGTGIMALAAINAALFWRRGPGGTGQYLDISLLDFYFQSHEINVQVCSTTGGAVQPHRGGSHHPVVAPLGVFRGREGYIVVVAIAEQWRRVCAAMERPELIDDPRFATNEARKANLEAVVSVIEEWMAGMPSDEAILRRLAETGVPAAPVLSVADAMRHPHLVERGTVRRIPDPVFGSFEVPGMPMRFSAFPPAPSVPAPLLGEHNAAVLGGLLGYDAGRVAALEAAGVLHAARR